MGSLARGANAALAVENDGAVDPVETVLAGVPPEEPELPGKVMPALGVLEAAPVGSASSAVAVPGVLGVKGCAADGASVASMTDCGSVNPPLEAVIATADVPALGAAAEPPGIA